VIVPDETTANGNSITRGAIGHSSAGTKSAAGRSGGWSRSAVRSAGWNPAEPTGDEGPGWPAAQRASSRPPSRGRPSGGSCRSPLRWSAPLLPHAPGRVRWSVSTWASRCWTQPAGFPGL